MTMSDHIAIMNGGIVQQFGTPAEVYGRPANLFVAGFIGSPPMNLLPGAVQARDGMPTFISDDTAVPLRSLASRLTLGQQVVLGVRPQDLTLATQPTEGGTVGRVWVVELIGSEKLVDVDLGGKRRLTVQVPASVSVGDDETVRIWIDPERVHVFDAVSGLRVAAG
jgi:ABC-type sugar transport system ATPase subunit